MDDGKPQEQRSVDRQRNELITSMLSGEIYGPVGHDGEQVHIPASLISELNEVHGENLRGKTLRIRSAVIEGRLEFVSRELHFGLSITASVFEEPPSFYFGSVQSLDFRGCRFPELKFEYVVVAGQVCLDNVIVDGNCQVSNTRSDSSFSLSEAQIFGDLILAHDILAADLKVNDSVIQGRIYCESVVSRGRLSFRDTKIESKDIALELKDCHVHSLDLGNMETPGKIQFHSSFTHHAKLPAGDLRAVKPDQASIVETLHPGMLGLESNELPAEDSFTYASGLRRILRHDLVSAFMMSLVAVGLLLGIAAVTLNVLGRMENQPTVENAFSVAQAPLTALAVAVISGIFSCCTLEVFKRLLELRGLYQWLAFRKWLVSRLGTRLAKEAHADLLTLISGVSFPPSANHMQHKLMMMFGKGGGFRYSQVFGLPLEQFSAQVANCIEEVISKPGNYSGLFRALGGDATFDSESRELIQRNNEQKSIMSVDQMQIHLGAGWRRATVAASTLLSGLWGLLFIYLFERDLTSAWIALAASIFVGGFTSWLLHDFAANVAKLRR